MKAINYLDENGIPVFHMYLNDDPRNCVMTLNFSIDRALISTKNTERIIACIEERRAEGLRDHFVEKLFDYIRKECKLR